MGVAPAARRPRNRRGEGHLLADAIVAAAYRIIEDTGDEAQVTLSEVARRVGVAAPSIYDHFPSAAAIRQAVVAQCWNAYDTEVLQRVDSNADTATGITQWAHLYVGFAREHPGSYRILYSRDHSGPVDTVGFSARSSLTALGAAMAALSSAAPDDPAANDAALGLWIQLHGIAVLRPAHPRFPWPSDDQLVESALRRCGVPAAADQL